MKIDTKMKREYFSKERRKMTAEQRFAIGLKTDEEILKSISMAESGRLQLEDLDIIRQMIVEWYSIMEVSRRFGIGRDTVYAILEVTPPACLMPPPAQVVAEVRKRFSPSPEQLKVIVQEYEGGESSRSLAKRYDTDRRTLKRLLVKCGAIIRDERHDGLSRAQRLTEFDQMTIDKLYGQDHSPDEIVIHLGGCATKAQVLYYLRQGKHKV